MTREQRILAALSEGFCPDCKKGLRPGDGNPGTCASCCGYWAITAGTGHPQVARHHGNLSYITHYKGDIEMSTIGEWHDDRRALQEYSRPELSLPVLRGWPGAGVHRSWERVPAAGRPEAEPAAPEQD